MRNFTIPRHPKGYGHWRLDVYRVADPKWTAGVNRIMGYRIGWFVVLGKWSVGLCKPEGLETQRERAEGRLR